MGWDNDIVALVPVALSSIIASVSALIKFKKFPEQQEVILQAQSLLTHTLANARNQEDLSQNLLKEYHESLEKLETSIYPDIRKKFLKQSHNNLISIMKQEAKFYSMIDMVNNGENVDTDDSLSSKSNPLDVHIDANL
jgi:hypothetical protein